MRLQWRDLVCGYPGREPLNLAFSGEVSGPGLFAILGPNGSGKSTLMRTWLGLASPLAGGVQIDHRCCAHGDLGTPCLGYVPQFHKVNRYFPISVQDLVLQGFGPRFPRRSASTRVLEVLADLEIEAIRKESFHELSLGQKTRVLIARALVSRPSLLFLDEPLANLDGDCQRFVVSHLKHLVRQSGVSVFLIDHHLDQFESEFDGQFVFERRHYLNPCRVYFEMNSASTLQPESGGGHE